jgi:hypothetical protein
LVIHEDTELLYKIAIEGNVVIGNGNLVAVRDESGSYLTKQKKEMFSRYFLLMWEELFRWTSKYNISLKRELIFFTILGLVSAGFCYFLLAYPGYMQKLLYIFMYVMVSTFATYMLASVSFFLIKSMYLMHVSKKTMSAWEHLHADMLNFAKEKSTINDKELVAMFLNEYARKGAAKNVRQ